MPMRDVFYYGDKPNVHPRERLAKSFEDACQLATTEHFWIINEFCDYRGFDWDFNFDFFPDEDVWAENHINIWPSQHQKDSGTWLCANNGSEIKIYRADVQPVKRKNEKNEFWVILDKIDESTFDFSWHPDPTDPPYIYKWGCKYYPVEIKSCVEYHTPGATGTKYINTVINVLPEWDRWVEIQEVDKNKFDFSWRPNPLDPPFIYVWGNKWIEGTLKSTLEYHTPGATEIKYMPEKLEVLPEWDRWVEVQKVDHRNFDFSWRPDPREPAYIYTWGNKWIAAEDRPTLEYHCENATDRKYMTVDVPVLPELGRWKILKKIDEASFDFTWRPDPKEPAYIYQFATLLDDIWIDDGPRYTPPNNNGEVVRLNVTLPKNYSRYYIETTLEDLVKQHPNEMFWALNKKIDYNNFDFSWIPAKENLFNVSVFGSKESELTHTYFVNAPKYLEGYCDFNFIEDKKASDNEYLAKLFVRPDIFYIDRSNAESKNRFEELKKRFPNIQKTRYLNSWVDTINRCVAKSSTELLWILNSELDYSNFDFEYYPNPWQMKMVHVFGTQWSHWGTTFLLNKETFTESTKYVKIIEHLNILNFVKEKRAKATECLYDIVLVDHGNKECNDVSQLIKIKTGRTPEVIKFDKSYLKTFKEYIGDLLHKKEYYIWVCSSICDYADFDFSYICDPYAKDQLHVFPSDEQKFGDTFLVDVNKFISLIDDMIKLEDYEKVNFNQHQKVKRLPAPIISVKEDTHTEINKYKFDFPYAVFETEQFDTTYQKPISLWAEDAKTINIMSTGGTRIIVPKEIYGYSNIKELYDYPYISTATKLLKSKPLDIVFLSNGEKNADENYEHLLKVTKGLKNRVIRVDGIKGRVQAYHASANASNTAWAFTVFAKLKVNDKFDWDWQPDRLQIPKHYIFTAINPLNGLEYGHQAMIAYNKKLVLNNNGTGLDFTLDDPHEVVNISSGIANYNTDEYSTWRTAFREAIKLKADISTESDHRLNIWLTKAEGDFAEYSIKGATDAIKYYEEVGGDIDKLRLSYEWEWLSDYFNQHEISNKESK
jgi:hypothetical protein